MTRITRFGTITISSDVREALQKRGHAGQSFNDVLRELLGLNDEEQRKEVERKQ